MWREQILWAQEIGVDLFVCETFREYAEASLALKTVKEFAPGVPCMVSIVPHLDKTTKDEPGLKYGDAMARLKAEGACLVGLNCARGPDTILPVLTDIRKDYKGPLYAAPIPYRTTPLEPTWIELTDPKTGELAMSDQLDAVGCSCRDIEEFAKDALALDIRYLGTLIFDFILAMEE